MEIQSDQEKPSDPLFHHSIIPMQWVSSAASIDQPADCLKKHKNNN